MSIRNFGSVLFGLAILTVVGFTCYKIIVGKYVGFNDVSIIGALLMLFFSNLTWGTKGEKDRISQNDELGQRIIEKSSKVSYFLMMFFIFGAVVADKLVNKTINVFLLLLLGLSLITLPFIEFLIAKRYQ